MKAMVYRGYGGFEKLELAELPEPGPGQLLIKVFAASVNPIDWKKALRKLWPFLRARFPQIPGYDTAGQVVRLGDGVTGFTPGDRVHACLSNEWATAEYALAKAELVVPMPLKMDYATAAGLPMAGITALQGLRAKGGLSESVDHQRVLVLGASGGVGHLAVQIAHADGARVIGVCSARNKAMVEKLGADQVLDYSLPHPYESLEPCDIIFDCVGESWKLWESYLKDGGRFVTTVPG
jgi:NADPH:quinone reductase-like Zn-dependent oxidoreductase